MSSNNNNHNHSNVGNDTRRFDEGGFTSNRPPQRNLTYTFSMSTEGRPRNFGTDGMQPYLLAYHDIDTRKEYAPSTHTDSTTTVMPDDAAVAAAAATLANTTLGPHSSPREEAGSEPSPRSLPQPHILDFVIRDYEGDAVHHLTEQAIAAHDHHAAMSYNGDVNQWVQGQQLYSDHVSVDFSVLVGNRTAAPHSESTVGSSWTFVSSMTPPDSDPGQTAFWVCAAGLRFEDVAGPRALDLADEDLV